MRQNANTHRIPWDTGLMCVRPHGYPESARKAEIGQLQIVSVVDQEILRLEITVQNAMRVAIKKARI